MQETIVIFKTIGEVVVLFAPNNEGKVDESVTPPRLVGTFRLRLDLFGTKCLSNPINFGPGAIAANVNKRKGQWELSALASLTVLFNAPISVRAPGNVQLVFSYATVEQPADEKAEALVSLSDMSLSLAPNRDPSGILRLVFPASGGWDEVDLLPLYHPSQNAKSGFFIQRLEDGAIALLAGNSPFGCRMDHLPEMFVFVGGGCTLLLYLIDDSGGIDGALHFLPDVEGDLALLVSSKTGLLLQRGPPSLGTLSLRALTSLVASRGMLVSEKFADSQMMLRRSNVPDEPENGSHADDTLLFDSADQFSFHLEIPKDSIFDPTKHLAEFRYINNRFDHTPAKLASDPWYRFHGLRVAGLCSNRGRQEIFDTSHACVRLMPVTNGESQFHFEAGGMLDGVPIPSLVIPKPDPVLSGRRVATMSTCSLSLRIGDTDLGEPPLKQNYLILRTANATVDLVKPILVGPPIGHAATLAEAKLPPPVRRDDNEQSKPYANWVLRLPGNVGQSLKLSMSGTKVIPPPKWTEPFVTETSAFNLLEQPGAGIKMLGTSGSIQALVDNVETKVEVTFERPDSTKKLLVFSAAALVAGLYPYRKGILDKLDEFRKNGEAFLDTQRAKIHYRFAEMTPAQLKQYVQSREVDKLQFSFFSTGLHDPSNALIAKFIDDNLQQLDPGGKPVAKFYMSFDVSLSIILFDSPALPLPSVRRYAYQIMYERASQPNSIRPGILFNFAKDEETNPAGLDWTDAEWKTFAMEQPTLWPRKRDGVGGARLDPSAKGWNGIMMRDLPVGLILAPEIREGLATKSPTAAKFYDVLNGNLQLKYGWIDVDGPTWYVTLANPSGYDFTPDGWETFMTFRLESMGVTGAGGKPAGAEGILSLQLHHIKDKNDKSLTVKGRFGLDITQSNPITVMELSIMDPQGLTTAAIPGFEKVTITGVTTDLVTATITMDLRASEGLAAALPIFKKGVPTPASLILNFGAKTQSDVQLSIQTDKETNLFGRYPMTIQGIYLQFGQAGSKKNRILVRGRLGLGLPGLEALGADLILCQQGDSWDFDVYINEIDVKLSLGDNFHLEGLLSWAPDSVDIADLRKPGGFKKPLSGNDLPTQKEARNFWAVLALKTGPFIGDMQILMKIGTHGERTFWVGAAQSSTVIRLGHAKLESPAIVFAHNADIADGGGLRKFITNPYANLIGAIRPPDGDPNDPGKDLTAKRDWLKQWVASDDIGSVVAGSGYLHFSDTVAESPRKDEASGTKNKDLKYLTALIASDSGLFRLDAQTKFMNSTIIGFGVAIDTQRKRIMAAIRAPEIAIPDKKNPKYVISPGTMSIELSYDPNRIFFGISIGWPPLINGSEIERDWTQSTKVYIAELVPINTFWGGYRAQLDAVKGEVQFGYAIRAGWTWKTEMNGADVAKASAELGITLGGVLEFTIKWKQDSLFVTNNPLQVQDMSAIRPALLNSRQKHTVLNFPVDAGTAFEEDFRAMQDAFEIMNSVGVLDLDLEVDGTVYGDIWGKGSVEFLGVTLASVNIALRLRLQVCGGSHRGITRIYGHGEIEIQVTILCVTFTGHAGFDLWIKRGECKSGGINSLIAPRALLQDVTLSQTTIPLVGGNCS